jgi:predicted aspartyl protease
MRGTFHVLALLATVATGGALVGRAEGPISPADAELQYQLGTLLFGDTRYHEAIVAFDRASAAEDPRIAIQARKGTARASLLIAEFGAARVETERLRREAPDDLEAQTLHAEALWSSGYFDESDQVYADVLARNPAASRARLGRARSLATVNRLDEALQEALTALAASPRDGEIHFEVGNIYEKMRRYSEAAESYSNYANLLPDRDRSQRAAWSRAEVRFLRAFEGKTPIDIAPALLEARHTVPFTVVSGKIVVRGKLNGGRERNFVLDTGSEETVLSEETAQDRGVKPITYTLSAGVGDIGLRGLQLGIANSFEVGTLKVKNVPVLIKSPGLTGMPKREADSFSPLALGLSVTVDYRNQVMTLGRHLTESGVADFRLPLRMNRLALVRGVLNGSRPAYFVVDTGGEVLSISTTVAESLKMKPARHIPLKVHGMSGWDRDAFLLPGVNLAFKDLLFRNTSLVVLNLRIPSALLGFEVGGIVGHRFLEKYRVTLDIDESELRLTRN